MSQLSPRDRRTLKEILEQLVRPVEIWAFLGDGERDHELAAVLNDTVQLSAGQLRLKTYEADAGESLAGALGIETRPALRVAGPGGEVLPVEVLGAPLGYQFAAFVQLLVQASRSRPLLGRAAAASVKNLRHNVLLEVQVAPTCPHSPQVVRLTQDVAMANPGRIFARAVDVLQSRAAGGMPDDVPVLTVVVDGRAVATHTGMLSSAELVQMIWRTEKETRRYE
jgi:alkyl hydroperoxide reductase subunit AhpF